MSKGLLEGESNADPKTCNGGLRLESKIPRLYRCLFDKALGAALMQMLEQGHAQPVYYVSLDQNREKL